MTAADFQILGTGLQVAEVAAEQGEFISSFDHGPG
jgi:hypothetical protein